MCSTPEGHVEDIPENDQDDAPEGNEHMPAQASRLCRSPPPVPRPQQAYDRMRELDEFQCAINKERAALRAATGRPALAHARDVHRCILNDEGAPPEPQVFGRASQNLAAATLLL